MSVLTNMPKLTDFRKTKIVELPSYPDSKVEIYDSILVGDAFNANKMQGNELAVIVEVLPKLIKSWNFTGEDDKPLEITRDNINFFKADDVAFLLKTITDFANENKKK